jgi:hypothetical protein
MSYKKGQGKTSESLVFKDKVLYSPKNLQADQKAYRVD